MVETGLLFAKPVSPFFWERRSMTLEVWTMESGWKGSGRFQAGTMLTSRVIPPPPLGLPPVQLAAEASRGVGSPRVWQDTEGEEPEQGRPFIKHGIGLLHESVHGLWFQKGGLY